MLFLLTMHLDETEKECITQIYYDYRKLMMAIAVKYVKDTSKAEDIVQESFFKIRNNLPKITSLTCNKKRSYIVYIVKSVSIDYLRKSKKRNSDCTLDESLEIKSNSASPFDELFLKEIRLGISKIIAEMDERDAKALIGKYYYGYSTKELCELLNINSQNSMLSVIYRARKKFIKLLNESEDING